MPNALALRQPLTHFPRPEHLAADAIRDWAHTQGVALDPDQVDVVTLHYQFHQGQWVAQVTQRQSLTQALLSNWQGESANNLLGALFQAPWAGHPPPGEVTVVDELPYRKGSADLQNGAEYAIYNGLYHRHTPPRYSPHTQVPLAAEGFVAFVEQLDFIKPYLAALGHYWARSFNAYTLAAKVAFVAACNKQVSEGSLSRAGQQLAWAAAGLTDALAGMLRVAPLNIYGYVAADLLCLEHATRGTTLLYIPGNASPLLEFAHFSELRQWVAQQCRSPAKRDALRAHFPQRDGPDGLGYSGLATALQGLGLFPQPHRFGVNHEGFATSGHWDPQVYVQYKPEHYSPLLAGDVFKALAERQRHRSFADASFCVTSDTQVAIERWRHYLSAAMNLLAPVALALPELAPLFAASGLAQFGLGLDAALHGKNLADRTQGAAIAAFGLLNATPLLQRPGFEAGELFNGKRDSFVLPTQVNGRPGYPLGPVRPPRWPAEVLAEYFPTNTALAPAPGADAAVAGRVVRIARYIGGQDLLQAVVDGHNVNVLYDVHANAFAVHATPTPATPPLYAPGTGIELVPIGNPAPAASDAQRSASLRALGIDLDWPVDLAALLPKAPEAIPKLFSSLWVGDQPLSEALISNLSSNARLLKVAGYRYRLLLSRAHPAVHGQNLARLQAQAPALDVLTLEDQPLFSAFAGSPYYPHYQAALAGEGRNYASAADILRYRVLHADGGVYMDVDDRLLHPGQYVVEAGQGYAEPAEAVAVVPLRASGHDLLLYPPASHEQLGLHVQYNTSLIGSQPGNPTLNAVSEEISRRLDQVPDFYASKPRLATDPTRFYRYAAELSRLTGPAVFNDVLQAHCPELYVLRQLANLAACPHRQGVTTLDDALYRTITRARLPFSRFATLGHAGSWQG